MSNLIEFEGKTNSILGWSKKLGIPYATIYNRFKQNLPVEEILNTDKKTKLGCIEYNGEVKSLREWANEIGLSYNTLWRRYKEGWRGEDLFSEKHTSFKKGRRITFNGETLSLAGWGRKLGISREAIRQRLERGIPIDVALSKEYSLGSRLVEKKDSCGCDSSCGDNCVCTNEGK